MSINAVIQGPCKFINRNAHCSRFYLRYQYLPRCFSSKRGAYVLGSKNIIHHETKNTYITKHTKPSIAECSLISRQWFMTKSLQELTQTNICGYSIRQFSSSPSKYADDPNHSKHRDLTDTLNNSIVKKLQHVEDSLRYHGYSTIRIGLFFIVTIGE